MVLVLKYLDVFKGITHLLGHYGNERSIIRKKMNYPGGGKRVFENVKYCPGRSVRKTFVLDSSDEVTMSCTCSIVIEIELSYE